MQVTVNLGPEVFRFETFWIWVHKASQYFRRFGVDTDTGVCVDAKGRICTRYEHFWNAREEDAYPIVVYRVRVEVPCKSDG